MPTRTFRHEFALAASARDVFDHLRDPQSYVGLSPLVVAVRDVREVDAVVHYTAVERVPIVGAWHIDNPIKVTIVAEGDGPFVVRGDVDSPGGVTLAYRYDIADSGGGCALVDEITLTAPLGLTRFAASRARAVQLARARILAERLG